MSAVAELIGWAVMVTGGLALAMFIVGLASNYVFSRIKQEMT